jgi:predicted hydrocarbon binding protein
LATQEPRRITPNKIDDFFTLDLRTGAIFNQLTEQRVQVIPVLRWAKLKEELYRQFSEKAQLIISIIGFNLGGSLAEESMAQISEPVALTKFLSDVMASAGWGVFSFTGDTQYGSKLVISVANCGFCDKENELSALPQCDFLGAALKGIADKVYGTPHKVREDRCAAKGEVLCQFEIEECEDYKFCDECRSLKYCEFEHGSKVYAKREV